MTWNWTKSLVIGFGCMFGLQGLVMVLWPARGIEADFGLKGAIGTLVLVLPLAAAIGAVMDLVSAWRERRRARGRPG